MKIMWIVNKPAGQLHIELYGKPATGGLWIDAMIQQIVRDQSMRLIIVNVMDIPKVNRISHENIVYYTLPGENNEHYQYKSSNNMKLWSKIIEDEHPDVLQIWGCEFPIGLAAMNAVPELPTIIYIQGILRSIEKYYTAGLTNRELKIAKTFRDVVTGTSIIKTKNNYNMRSDIERCMIEKAGNVIVENQWAAAYCKTISPSVNIYFCKLNIDEAFYIHQWSEDNCQKHTIMCPAANYPIKGLHMLLKAVAIVKEVFSDVKLYIPGTPLREPKGIKEKLKQQGYDKLIIEMLKQYSLTDHVVYTGRLTSEEMATHMAKVNCFVMSSAIENHSSTLKEAMTVGVPCIASYVGGVPEYAVHEKNCLLYRFEDYEVLAGDIIRLFEDENLCKYLSNNSIKDFRSDNNETAIYDNLIKILKSVSNV